MKSLFFLTLIMLLCISLSAQKFVYVINSERELLWDTKTNKQIGMSERTEQKLLIIQYRDVDSVLFVYDDKTIGYQIVPKSKHRDAEGTQMGFIADTKGGNYIDIAIKVRLEDWLLTNDKNLLKGATIYVNDCDRQGNAKPDKSGLLVHCYKIDNIISAK